MAGFFSTNTFAEEKKNSWPWWISAEVEFMKMSSKQNTDAAFITKIPFSFRNIPIHPDDPSFTLKGMVADESPFIIPLSTNIAVSSMKVWFFSTFGVGLVIEHGKNGPYLPLGSSDIGTYTSLQEDEVVFDVVKRNYMADYDVHWGPAYHMYRLSAVEKSGLPFFVEVKTPVLPIVDTGDGIFSIGFYGGYQPKTSEISFYATNGYHRYGEFEPKDRYKLGEISFSQVYGGLNLVLVNPTWDWGLRFFAAKDLVKTSISSHGEDFGLELLDDVPMLYGFSIYVSYRIF